ncbi:MAG TPA: glycosyltransferase family 4 protein [Phycisphaerales bacterium]|nr:glycosyltransferase family 4 protein [Phycisphaerales bacterium]
MSRPIRALYSFAGRLGRTGIGVTAWNQLRGLVDEGIEVHLFCGTCERDVPGVSSITQTMKPAGLRIPYRVLGTQRAWGWHDWFTARAVRRGLNIDLVHAWPLGARRTFEAAKARRIPTLLERPNTHTGFAFEVVGEELRKLGLELPHDHSHRADPRRLAVEEEEYRMAEHFLCPSEFVASTFIQRGFPAARISRTQYGYDPREFWSQPQRPAGPLTFGFVGSCEPRKGLHLALEAWSRSRAREAGRFVICGRFVPGYREKLEPYLKDPSVQVIGYRSDVGATMRECDVLVLPSIEEGSALVTYEARACGCVLMVSDAAGARCEHMVNGLVHTARNVQQLREHFDLLADSPDLLEQLRQASLAGVGNLTWSAAARRLVSVYRTILGREPQEHRDHYVPREREPVVQRETVA